MTEELQAKIKLLPLDPGVYVMLDAYNNIIYVGKAKRLKNRVTQYFRNGFKTEKVAQMVMNIADFYYIITPTERDALSLENNLIKKHKPKYNILLKDDKTYPYIRVNIKDDYPTFSITRKPTKDGAKYFGPFMCGVNVNDVLSIIRDAFKVRNCKYNVTIDKTRKECLNYHIGLCLAPCSKRCSRDEYMVEVNKAVEFLSGNDSVAEKILTEKMAKSVENEEFETAIALRDRLKMLSALKERRITAINKFITADIITVASNGVSSAINLLFVRNGRMLGSRFFIADTLAETDGERLTAFIGQFYQDGREIPDEIILPFETGDNALIAEYLTVMRDKTVEVTTPKQGVKKRLIDMSFKNANEYLEKQIGKIKRKDDMTISACKRLQEVLGLTKYPRRIECFDISHISGVDKVGSMTVFIDGEPSKNDYRRFKIKTVEGNNDFECLKEVLTRRLSKLNTDEEEKFPRPDLIVIDGGKGQLTAVKTAFNTYANDIEFISLAEREEEIFIPNNSNPIVLLKSDNALKVLIRIRDEAHRFAITFNRSLRGKRTLKSVLTEIEGIGKKKRDALMNTFKDIESIKKATLLELTKVDGIGKAHAEKIIEYFKNN